MISINPNEVLSKAGPEFSKWQDRARRATQELRRAAKPGEIRFDHRVWIDFKPLLRSIFHGKCAYCESNVDVAGHGDVEMYRPKSLYPYLAYDWHNLLYSCAICNQRYKKNQFPLKEKKARASAPSPESDTSAEEPLLLHPYFDQPQEHLSFSAGEETREVHVTGLNERGRTTIDVLGLNRPELLLWRFETWNRVRTLLDTLSSVNVNTKLKAQMIRQVRESLSDSAVYAGAVRQLCRAQLESTLVESKWATSQEDLLTLLGDITVSISPEQQDTAEREHKIAREELRSYSVDTGGDDVMEKFNFAAKRIDRIEVQNLRTISHLDLTFPAMAERESWLMLIGENGVGKSTILQGVALALMGESRANRYELDASTFVQRGGGAGFVRVHINAIGTVTLHFENGSAKFTVDPPEPKVPLLAYGPTRLLPSETANTPLADRNIRTDNLFKPTIPLSDAESWLADTWKEDREGFYNVGRALCRLLLINERTLPRMNDGKVEIRMPDGWRRLSDLSAGYRSVLALVVDIAIGTSGKRNRIEDAVGIVLLDEIEVHLHPMWKISIVERLRNVFPQLSFLATTHDPLCLKGLYDREIVALRRGRSGRVTFATDLPSVENLKADDILTSKELFELPSSRSRTSALTIARYSALLNKPAPSEKEKRELQRLSRVISEMLSGSIAPMQHEVERVVTSVMKELRSGKEGRELTRDVVAEIRRHASEIGDER